MTGDLNSPTGDEYIDHHALCSRVPDSQASALEQTMRSGDLFMNAMLTIACFIMAAAGCRSAPSDSDLRRFVHGYCFNLEESLRHAAQRHRQLAPALDDNRLSPDQLQRAEADLALESVGVSTETRQARLQDFESRTRFCESVHQVPDASATNLDVRLEAIHVALDRDLRTGAMPSAAKTADVLDQFSSLVHEINALPLRD